MQAWMKEWWAESGNVFFRWKKAALVIFKWGFIGEVIQDSWGTNMNFQSSLPWFTVSYCYYCKWYSSPVTWGILILDDLYSRPIWSTKRFFHRRHFGKKNTSATINSDNGCVLFKCPMTMWQSAWTFRVRYNIFYKYKHELYLCLFQNLLNVL